MELVFENDGYFRFLDYHISHKQLLIRGERALDDDNVDIAFEGTEFVHCPTTFEGLKIYALDENESVERGISLLPFSRNFLFVPGGNEHYIQAAILRLYRNNLHLFESSIDMTGRGQENLLRFG